MSAARSTRRGGRLKQAALAWIVTNFVIGVAVAQAGEPHRRGAPSPSEQRHAAQAQALQEARRRAQITFAPRVVPAQPYVAQQPLVRPAPANPYLVPQPGSHGACAFFDPVLGIRGQFIPGLGVEVLGVRPWSPAYHLGLEPGDVLVRLNGRQVYDAATIRQAIYTGGARFHLVVLDVRTGTHQVRWGQLARY